MPISLHIRRLILTQDTVGTPDYTMGFSEEFMESLKRVSAETEAGYLLPYLRPGFRLLDVGCGLGTISVGLAGAVAPGEMHGLDMEASQIEMARSYAQAYGADNATFHVGDAVDLPFEDDSFDVVSFQNVIMHIPDTREVFAEAKRVLKSGGIIGCREMIVPSSFTYPDFGVIGKAWDMFEDLLSADDGHPQMGKELKGHLVKAGFENVEVTLSSNLFSTPADVDFIYRFVQGWFLSQEITEAAIKYGAATRELCDEISAAYDRWRTDPAAVLSVAFGEAVANKP